MVKRSWTPLPSDGSLFVEGLGEVMRMALGLLESRAAARCLGLGLGLFPLEQRHNLLHPLPGHSLPFGVLRSQIRVGYAV